MRSVQQTKAIRIIIRFSVCLISGCAHVFMLLSIVIEK